MKKPIAEIEPIPSKRIFYSIIADYNLNRAVCELIDNAIDQWTKKNRGSRLNVNLRFDLSQQTVRITDDAGGVAKDGLEILVGPGLTSNKPEEPTIGLFGVGTKRAVVALAEDVKIRIGSAVPSDDEKLTMEIRGRDLMSGLPKTIKLHSPEITAAIAD